MNLSKPEKLFLRALATLGLVGGVIVLYLSARGPSSFPAQHQLSTVTGSVEWTQPDRYGIDFAFAGDARKFSYARKSGDILAVSAALKSPKSQPLTVLVLPHHQQGLVSDPFFQVYEVRASNGTIRTLSQVRESWGNDYKYGYLAALFAFVAAAGLEFCARKSQPN